MDEINEILGERIKSGKKVLKDKEAHYAELINSYRNGSNKNAGKGRKGGKKSKGKSKNQPVLTSEEKYMVYGVAAALMAVAAYHFLSHRK